MMKYLQKLGKALMLPVAVLPICGILMGLGYAFAPGVMGVPGAATSGAAYTVGFLLVKAGGALIDNMAWLFAIGAAVGLADDHDGTAGLAGLVSFLMMQQLLSPAVVGAVRTLEEGTATYIAFQKVAGNSFIGILAAVVGATCYNKFKNTQMPDWLAFFSGKRFVAIATGLISIVVSVVLLFVWPLIFGALVALGEAIASMGGIDRADAQPDEILAYARDALARYCPGGHFIPSITYGLAGTVFPHVDQYLDQAVNEYNAGLHIPVTPLPAVPKREIGAAKAEVVQAATSAQESADVFENIARALERGQQKKLLTLCQQALDEGHEPGDILSKGMIIGMNRLGEAFSANRAFVPEMLMAARCMSAATELLKPLMVGEGTEPVGRVCLGTVKGDMHDIGKNLVRIMMEGSGIEVFDLGVDTSAEQFVSTAVENHCGVIACSSLLTTTMEEMREVVKLVHERGLQDQIKVIIGGAPISQSFCDEIGADFYGEDAGASAREAVKILKVQKAS